MISPAVYPPSLLVLPLPCCVWTSQCFGYFFLSEAHSNASRYCILKPVRRESAASALFGLQTQSFSSCTCPFVCASRTWTQIQPVKGVRWARTKLRPNKQSITKTLRLPNSRLLSVTARFTLFHVPSVSRPLSKQTK